MKLKTVLSTILTCLAIATSGQSLAQAENAATVQTSQEMVQNQAAAVIGDRVNINTATASELQKALIGIGAKKAQAIVQYRETHGKFTALEQLLEVQGIGRATLEKNSARIML